MRLDAERSSTYRIFTEYRADRPELQLEKRAAPALKVLLDATRRSTGLSVPIPCRECRHGPPDREGNWGIPAHHSAGRR